MRVLTSVSVVPAEVGRSDLYRHRMGSIPSSRIFVMTDAIGLPRLWHMSNETVLRAFTESMEKNVRLPITERLDTAMHHARVELVKKCQLLVERMAPDVAILAIGIEDDGIHVSSVGATRAYIYRSGVPRRLTTRQDDIGGVLTESPVRSQMSIEAGDIILAGSVSAFSSHAVTRVTAILTADREASPSTLSSVLTEPAAKSGVGAAALVVRL